LLNYYLYGSCAHQEYQAVVKLGCSLARYNTMDIYQKSYFDNNSRKWAVGIIGGVAIGYSFKYISLFLNADYEYFNRDDIDAVSSGRLNDNIFYPSISLKFHLY
jgi:hypothetical protein